MDIAIESAIIGGLVGATIVAVASYFISKQNIKASFDLIRLQDTNKARAAFRNAFLHEIIFLKHNANIPGYGSYNNLNDLLASGYFRHLKALEIFSTYLSPKERVGINKAWKEYCHYDIENETGPYFAMYAEEKWEGKNTKELALNRIHKLLNFAKP